MSRRLSGTVRPQAVLASALICIAILPMAASAQERPTIEVVPQIPHAAGVSAAAFSSDGRLVLTGSRDTTLKLWEVATFRLIRTFVGHTAPVLDVALSPDARLALSVSSDRTLRLWEAATGRLVHKIEPNSVLVGSVAISPDGAWLLSGRRGTAELWDAATGRLIRTFRHGTSLDTVAFSPDGTNVLTGGYGDKSAKLWDAATGRLVQGFGDGGSHEVKLAFAPGGGRVAVGDRSTLRLWNTTTGALIWQREWFAPTFSLVAFSKDGARVVACCGLGGGVQLLHAETGRVEKSAYDLARSGSGYSVFAASPDATRVLLSMGHSESWLELWDVGTVSLLHKFPRAAPTVSIAVPGGGDRLLWVGESAHGLALWNTATGIGTRVSSSWHWARFDSVAVSPDGAQMVSAPQGGVSVQFPDVDLWDTATGDLVSRLKGRPSDGGVSSLVFSPDGARLVAGRASGRLDLWDAPVGWLARTLEGHSRRVGAVAFSPDGALIASGADDGTVKVWDARTGGLVRTLDSRRGWLRLLTPSTKHSVDAVALSPDGARVLSTETRHEDGQHVMTLWSMATGQPIHTFNVDRQVRSVAFSPDGTRLLSGGTIYRAVEDTPLKLWDAATGRLIRSFKGHFSSDTTSVAFSSDGRRIFSGGFDGTVRVWDAESSSLLATLLAPRGRSWLAATPEGFFEASSETTGKASIALVRGLEVVGIDRFYPVLHRPDLVRAKLAGDPEGKVQEAAAELAAKLQLN